MPIDFWLFVVATFDSLRFVKKHMKIFIITTSMARARIICSGFCNILKNINI